MLNSTGPNTDPEECHSSLVSTQTQAVDHNFPSKQFNLDYVERKHLLILDKQIMPCVHEQSKTDVQDIDWLKII